MTPGRI